MDITKKDKRPETKFSENFNAFVDQVVRSAREKEKSSGSDFSNETFNTSNKASGSSSLGMEFAFRPDRENNNQETITNDQEPRNNNQEIGDKKEETITNNQETITKTPKIVDQVVIGADGEVVNKNSVEAKSERKPYLVNETTSSAEPAVGTVTIDKVEKPKEPAESLVEAPKEEVKEKTAEVVKDVAKGDDLLHKPQVGDQIPVTDFMPEKTGGSAEIDKIRNAVSNQDVITQSSFPRRRESTISGSPTRSGMTGANEQLHQEEGIKQIDLDIAKKESQEIGRPLNTGSIRDGLAQNYNKTESTSGSNNKPQKVDDQLTMKVEKVPENPALPPEKDTEGNDQIVINNDENRDTSTSSKLTPFDQFKTTGSQEEGTKYDKPVKSTGSMSIENQKPPIEPIIPQPDVAQEEPVEDRPLPNIPVKPAIQNNEPAASALPPKEEIVPEQTPPPEIQNAQPEPPAQNIGPVVPPTEETLIKPAETPLSETPKPVEPVVEKEVEAITTNPEADEKEIEKNRQTLSQPEVSEEEPKAEMPQNEDQNERTQEEMGMFARIKGFFGKGGKDPGSDAVARNLEPVRAENEIKEK